MGIEKTSAQPQTVIGNLADLREGQIALPRFFIKRDNGLFVDLSRLESTEDLTTALDRIFSSDAYFLDLDYERFTKLLFNADPSEASKSKKGDEETSMIRIASDIVAFSAARRALYKEVKIGNGVAEYFFNPVALESEAEEPIYSEDNDGAHAVIGFKKKISSERPSLTFDEFVADMWLNGIHFGIDADVVRTAITTGASGRITIARRRDAVLGKAADIQELSKEIHRDDAPRMLPDGRADMRQFKNRFPQINKDVRLIKKIPRVLGTSGYEISGNPVEPPIPKDFNLASLSGPGTAVETNQEGEFIVSKQDGFLILDAQTNQISITEKIINLQGVSAKTTGNLILTGDEYEEHGEVQEKCLIEGNNMTMHADVFGTVASRGGKILLKSNLVGGAATNQEGDISVEGIASGAVVHTKNGTITMKRAENCVLIGTCVSVENASNCDILADQVNITEAEGCAIVAKDITLANAGPRKQSEMLVFVPVPDLAEFDRKIGAIQVKIEEIEQSVNKKSQTLESAISQPDVKKYLMVAGKLKKGEITLTPEQQGSMQKLAATANPTLRLVAKINAEIKQSAAEKQELADQAELLTKHRKAAESGVCCSIANITGEILVRTLKITPENAAALYDLPPQKLKAALRGSSMTGERIYAGHSGSLDWEFTAQP
jgi:hypothetical protein